MFKAKKFKLFTHHSDFLLLAGGRKEKKTNFFKKIFLKFAAAIYGLCVYAGLAVIWVGKQILNGAKNAGHKIFTFFSEKIRSAGRKVGKDWQKTKTSLKLRLKILRQINFFKNLGFFVLVSALLAFFVGAIKITTAMLELKDKIANLAEQGMANLETGKINLAQGNFTAAQKQFVLANEAFYSGEKMLAGSQSALDLLSEILPQKQKAKKILRAARFLTQAGLELKNLTEIFRGLKLSSVAVSSTRPPAEIFADAQSNLKKIALNLFSAKNLLAQIDQNSLPKTHQEKFIKAKSQIESLSESLRFAEKYAVLGKNLLSGKKTILALFENSNELRPSGGFLGSYGVFKLNDGKMEKIRISSIYDLDGQLKDKIRPPWPLINVNDRWFLRDSNWFAHFPLSAKKIIQFYEKEGGETPDFLIALTPNLLVEILKITGPISLPKYRASLDSENFVEVTQILGSEAPNSDLPSEPKQILADFFPVLLDRLSQLTQNDWLKILQVLNDSFTGKQAAAFSRQSELQNLLSELGLTGEILPTDRDYLSVNFSNLGGTKTDLYIEQNFRLNTRIEKDGSIINELSIKRTNALPNLPGAENLSFIRIYAPEGSKLISDEGFDIKPLDEIKLAQRKIDPDVEQWEKSLLKNLSTGTVIGQESGKTFFGNWQKLQGGESRELKLVYLLPFKIKNTDRHSLLLQKQLGGANQNFEYVLKFPERRLLWSNFQAPESQPAGSLDAKVPLTRDYFFGAVLSKISAEK